MAGSRVFISLIFALSAFLVIIAVSADDSGSTILTPIAETPIADYTGSDGPSGSTDPTVGAEGPDATLLGSPISGSGSEGDGAPAAPKHSGASNIRMTAAAVAASAFVGYLAF